MCGEKMRLKHHDRVVRVPGSAQQKTVQVAEWECPECDYFEEYNEEKQEDT